MLALAMACLAGGSTDLPPFDLLRGLAAIDAREARADVDFLAAPELGGRKTASPGARVAARYLEARAIELGFEPGTAGGYAHRFPLVRSGLDLEASRLTVASDERTVELRPGDDYVFASTIGGSARDVRGPIVTAEPVSGAWQFYRDVGGSLRRVSLAAARAGAVGLIAWRPEDAELRPFEDKYEALWVRQRDGALARAGSVRTALESLPTVCLTRAGRRKLERFAPSLEGLTVRERRQPSAESIDGINVVALWPGRDSEHRDECIVVCAHYDHVGRPSGRLHPGADDNASGSAGLAAIAAGLARGGHFERSVVLLWTSGEELGLWGAEAWAEDARLPAGLVPVAAMNLDMIGRTAADYLELTPTREHARRNSFAALCYEVAGAEAFGELASQDTYWQRSDHYALAEGLDIPVAYLSSGDHPDYHKPGDVPAKIDPDKIARVARVVLRVLAAADELDSNALAAADR